MAGRRITRAHYRDDADCPPVRRDPVRWFSPGVLIDSGLRHALAEVIGGFSDRRESRPGEDADVLHVAAPAGSQRAQVLFAADIGDGWTATTGVATQLVRRTRDAADEPATHRLLVLGGDTVYPVASRETFDERFIGPYTHVVREAGGLGGESPARMVAIPGNHDWYDGLASFTRVFCQGQDDPDAPESNRRIGGRDGWALVQRRSFWAVEVVAGCWLWGLDTQLDGYLDHGQQDFFQRASDLLRPGDDVLIVVPKPVWMPAAHGPSRTAAFWHLRWFEEHFVRARGATVAATLTGDEHFLADYAPVGDGDDAPHRITCGGGGAYTGATHALPEEIELSWTCWDDAADPPAGTPAAARYRLGEVWPTREESRRMSWRGHWRLFADKLFVVIGALHLLLQLLAASALEDSSASQRETDVWDLIVAATGQGASGLGVVLLFAVTISFAAGHGWVKYALGTLHGVAQTFVIAVALLLANRIWEGTTSSGGDALVIVTGTAIATVLGTLVLGVYWHACVLLLPRRTVRHVSDWFAGIGSSAGKSLLEITVDAQRITIAAWRSHDPEVRTWQAPVTLVDRPRSRARYEVASPIGQETPVPPSPQ